MLINYTNAFTADEDMNETLVAIKNWNYSVERSVTKTDIGIIINVVCLLIPIVCLCGILVYKYLLRGKFGIYIR